MEEVPPIQFSRVDETGDAEVGEPPVSSIRGFLAVLDDDARLLPFSEYLKDVARYASALSALSALLPLTQLLVARLGYLEFYFQVEEFRMIRNEAIISATAQQVCLPLLCLCHTIVVGTDHSHW
jgi:hypothetical protein